MPDGAVPSAPGVEAPKQDAVIILEPGDEKAQKIAKAMASRTAGEILQLLKDGNGTATHIAEALGSPITPSSTTWRTWWTRASSPSSSAGGHRRAGR